MQSIGIWETRKVDIRRRIGIDKIIIKSRVKSVDWDVFEMYAKNENVFLGECRSDKKKLSCCDGIGEEHWYSSIKINLGKNSLHIKKCNIPGCDDICNLTICNKSICNHAVLDNISNMTCDELKEYIYSVISDIKNYGIILETDRADVCNIEINLNLNIENGQFEKIINFFQPVSLYLDEGFNQSYRYQSNNLDKSNEREEYLNNIKTNIPGMTTTSIYAVAKTREIKIYNKSSETIKKANRYIESITEIARFEFVLKDVREVETYCNGKRNLFEMNQKDIEDAFHKLADKFLKKTIDRFNRECTKMLEEYFEQIDINENAWRKKFVAGLNSLGVRRGWFIIITIQELSRLVSLINAPSVKKNKSRIVKSIVDEIKNSKASCVWICENDMRMRLINWLCTYSDDFEQIIEYNVQC